MGVFKKWVEKKQQEIDDALTDAIGDGDYLIRTDDSDIKKPQDDGKE